MREWMEIICNWGWIGVGRLLRHLWRRQKCGGSDHEEG